MKYYVVDAFTSEVFKGNPAGVCILDKEISTEIMQKIASENNLSETAFAYKRGDVYKLKWFTPKFEIDLCGHATLATAFIICTYIETNIEHIKFETRSGLLEVNKRENQYEMLFPLRIPKKIEVTSEIIEALGLRPYQIYSDRDLYVVMKNEQEVKSFVPNYDKLRLLNKWLGIVITAEGTDCDFVSRFFCPELNLEDPVTGSSHSSLIPIWNNKLNKSNLKAKQLSERGGVLYCEKGNEYVKISGSAVLYLKGEIKISL